MRRGGNRQDSLGSVYGDTAATATTGREDPGFQVEYRWDHRPEEGAQPGLWFLLFASLVLTAVLAVDVCNSTAEDWDRVGMSGSRGGDGRAGAAGPRVGSGGGVLRPARGGDELRRRRLIHVCLGRGVYAIWTLQVMKPLVKGGNL